MIKVFSLRVISCIGLVLLLSACLFDATPKHLKPLSQEARKLLVAKGIKPGAPMFVRIFKEEAVFEAWFERPDGTYTLFKSYEICNWSGKLGPKLKTGDKQAPEGFYVITPAQMNPKSKYHLAFNLGYPNAYDRSYRRTGTYLMVHGGCSSAGCYAMTDDNVQEIYALARNAFMGGQREFPVHAFPFRMTEQNLQKYAKHKWAGFWRNLKAGHDYFELKARPPVVAVQNKRYVYFDSADQVPKALASRSKVRARAGDPVLITGWASASTSTSLLLK
jgi:murein L,D-transpeptidase YafK